MIHLRVVMICAFTVALCTPGDAQERQPGPTQEEQFVPVTFYYAKKPGRNWFTEWQISRPKGWAESILDGPKQKELVRLDTESFMTIKLAPGEHEFRAHRGFATTFPWKIRIEPGRRNYIRFFPLGYDKEYAAGRYKLFENVPCEQAREEAAQMKPLKPKNIKVRMDLVVDEGFYFNPQCSN